MSRPISCAFAATAVVAGILAHPCRAAGQAAPPPADPPPPNITVTAAPTAYKSSIDRKSYSLANDLQKATGSLADVLRNVPSVAVDAQGNVSLRGDPSVTILIDGRPSALFSDTSRADTLQQLSADQFDRIEVMTTPPASFRPDGTGGIINLISKKTAPGTTAAPTLSGSAKLNIGTGGRSNGGLTGAYAGHGLSLSGGFSFRHSVVGSDADDRLQFPDPVSGAPTPAELASRSMTLGDSQSVNGALDNDLDSRTHLSVSANHFQDRSHRANARDYRSAATTGPLALDYAEEGFWHGHFSQNGLTFGLARKLPDADHALSVQLTLSQDHVYVSTGAAYAYRAPVQPNLFQDLSQVGDDLSVDLKTEYKAPTPGGGKLTTGYELQADHHRLSALGFVGTSAEDVAPSPALTDVFRVDQQVHALYASLEQTFGELTVQPGLRLEQTVLALDQVTQAISTGQSYFGAYPSLHLAYELDDARQLKASYGRRVQRPGVWSLDPFRREASPTAFQAGNPGLKPEITNAYELGYEYRRKAVDYQATLYYRDKAGLFAQVEQEIAPAVLLTTEENLGRSRDAGIELVAVRDLTRTLSVNLSTNLFWSQVDAANLGILARRSAVLWSGRLSLNWQASKADFVHLSASQGGKRLTAQGYREDLATFNLGWRHTFDTRLAGVVTLQDPFDSYRLRTVVDTPTLRDQQVQTLRIRALFVGLTYAFGVAGKRPPEVFDFSTPPPK